MSAASLPVSALQFCSATDSAAGKTYGISWLVFQPIVAVPAGSNGEIKYQIATFEQDCTLNPAGVCVFNPGTTPATTYQEGTLDNGVAGVASNGVHWRFELGAGPPALGVVSTGGYAQTFGGGFCAVASSQPGEASFLWSGYLTVGYLPEGWCPDSGDSLAASYGVYGDCARDVMTVTIQPPQDRIGGSILPAPGPSCTAVPSLAGSLLANGNMR